MYIEPKLEILTSQKKSVFVNYLLLSIFMKFLRKLLEDGENVETCVG